MKTTWNTPNRTNRTTNEPAASEAPTRIGPGPVPSLLLAQLGIDPTRTTGLKTGETVLSGELAPVEGGFRRSNPGEDTDRTASPTGVQDVVDDVGPNGARPDRDGGNDRRFSKSTTEPDKSDPSNPSDGLGNGSDTADGGGVGIPTNRESGSTIPYNNLYMGTYARPGEKSIDGDAPTIDRENGSDRPGKGPFAKGVNGGTIGTVPDGTHPIDPVNVPPETRSTFENFFSLNGTPRLRRGGTAVPPKPGLAGFSRLISPVLSGQATRGGRLTPSPASQQVAVSGGVRSTALTAGSCEAGLGGDRHA